MYCTMHVVAVATAAAAGAVVIVEAAAVINNDNDIALYATATFTENGCHIVISGDP